MYGGDHKIAVTLRDMTDIEMFRIMGLENSEDWMNPVQYTEQVIKQARAFFDSWLDRFPGWPDFVQASGSGGLPEFGDTGETAIQQVTEWLGGSAEAPNNYARIVKYGVGIQILQRFTGIPKHTIEAALLALGPTEREKRMLEKIEAERQEALAEAELLVMALGDYDMLCCMIDENNTQQQITPKIVFENVIAALTLAERFLRSTENADEFNKLLKTSNRPCEDDYFVWEHIHYERAKNAIAETGDGLGKDVVKHFLPRHAVPANDTLQNAIDSHYAERRQADASQRLLWQGADANDQEMLTAAQELEKQALVFLGKVKVGGVTRALLCSLSNNEKASDPEAAGKE